jgi:hypothetical protein
VIDAKTDEELIAEAQKYYDERLRALLEPKHNGDYVVIDVKNQIHTHDRKIETAHERMQALGAEGPLVCLRVGSPVTFDLYRRQ